MKAKYIGPIKAFQNALKDHIGHVVKVESKIFDQQYHVDFGFVFDDPYKYETLQLSPHCCYYIGEEKNYREGCEYRERTLSKIGPFSVGDILTPEIIQKYNRSYHRWDSLNPDYTYKVIKATKNDGIFVEFLSFHRFGPVWEFWPEEIELIDEE